MSTQRDKRTVAIRLPMGGGGGWGVFSCCCFVKLDLNADIASSTRRKQQQQQQQQPLRPCTRFTHKEREREWHRNVPFRPLCQPVTGDNVSGVNTRTGAVTHWWREVRSGCQGKQSPIVAVSDIRPSAVRKACLGPLSLSLRWRVLGADPKVNTVSWTKLVQRFRAEWLSLSLIWFLAYSVAQSDEYFNFILNHSTSRP